MNKKEAIKKISLIFSLLNRLVPKNEKKIMFYSNMGFRDNVKALYDYISENNIKNYKIICSINDYKNYDNTRNVIFVSNLKGVFHFFTSKYFFYSFGKYPIKPSKNQVVVNLFHGTPLKRIGNMVDGDKNDYNYFTYILATSEIFVDIMMKSFNCKKEQVLIYGHARNDRMFKENNSLNKLGILNKYKKIIIWLPTFRKSTFLDLSEGEFNKNTALPIIKTNEELKTINKYLKNIDVFMIIKLHPAQDVENIIFSNFSNISIKSNEQLEKLSVDLYEILPYTDALITDYSSIYFDYMLLNKPIGFTIDDFHKYKENRGFVFDNPLDYMPGTFINNLEELKGFISDILKNNDKYKEKREKVNQLVNEYKDDKNSERLLNFLGIHSIKVKE